MATTIANAVIFKHYSCTSCLFDVRSDWFPNLKAGSPGYNLEIVPDDKSKPKDTTFKTFSVLANSSLMFFTAFSNIEMSVRRNKVFYKLVSIFQPAVGSWTPWLTTATGW